MKYVSGAEIFQSEKTVSVRAEECLKGEPALESEMERFWKDRERKSYCMMEIRSLWKKK